VHPTLAAIQAGAPTEPNLDVTLLAWAALGAAVVAMLAFDLLVFGRGREPTLRESVAWTGVWTVCALAFGAWLTLTVGSEVGGEFLAGYLLERSLSFDNLFVFAVIFGFFAVPVALQARALAWGIALALVLRLMFILIGAALLEAFHLTIYLFGALLLFTGYKLARHKPEHMDVSKNPVLRLMRRHVPMTEAYSGTRLSVREGGRRVATPLLAVLVVIAATDLMFAIDSIPAIYAVTSVPFIVFAANAFALLGMRALYFALVGLMERFVYLSYGLAVLLGFVGVKMLLTDVWKMPTWLSLAVIVAVLAVTALLSLRADRRARRATADAEREREPVAA
jgi:tellurite resistance protein TerC